MNRNALAWISPAEKDEDDSQNVSVNQISTVSVDETK